MIYSMAPMEKKSKKNLYSSSSMGFGAAAEKIESNDDLLMSILVGLPPKSVFRFRCASKRWNDIVGDSFFIRSYELTRKRELEREIIGSMNNNLMHFIQTKTCITFSGEWCHLKDDSCSDGVWRFINRIHGVSNDSSSNVKNKNVVVPKKFGFLIHSSNGLILCGRYHTDTYHVLNPFVRTCVSLPPPPKLPPPPLRTLFHDDDDDDDDDDDVSIGLVVCQDDNSLVPNFKVIKTPIRLDDMPSKFLQIQTYSSKTREWTHSILVATESFLIHVCKYAVFVFNGVLHWFTMDMGLAVYDSSSSSNNHVQLIVLPLPRRSRSFVYYNVTRDDDNILWFCVNNRRKEWLQLWMLPKNRGEGGGYRRSTTIRRDEWILMHTITHDLLPNDFNKTHNRIQLLWLLPIKAVFFAHGFALFIYNFETKSVESCFLFTRWFGISTISLYLEPPSLSSYALSPKAYDDDHDYQVVAS